MKTMADIRETITRLECCLNNQKTEFAHLSCSNRGCDLGGENCVLGLMADTLSLLKAQEPKTVTEMLVVGGHLMGKCPRCCKILTVQDHPIACGFCGQEVKWK